MKILSAVLLLAGCNRSSIIYSVAGDPYLTKQMKSKTITTRIKPDAGPMVKGAESATISELQRSGWKYVPKDGEIILDVDSSFGGRSVSSGYTSTVTTPMLSGYGSISSSKTRFDQMDVVNLRYIASEKGQPFWEAQMSGSSEYLFGEWQPGCIRELFVDRYLENESSEEACYKP